MKDFLKKILALSLTASLLALNVASAQTAPADATSTDVSIAPPAPSVSASATTTPDAPDTTIPPAVPDNSVVATSTEPANLQASTTPVQDAVTTQTTVTGDVLEGTTNPEVATTTTPTIPIVGTSTPAEPINIANATTTPESKPVAEIAPSLVLVGNVDVPTPDSVAPPVVPQTELVAVPLKVLPEIVQPAKPSYTFALTGNQIPTKRKVENKDGAVAGEETVASPLTSQVDNATGVVTISGQCADANYVVLLFKNQDDYVNDPRSYILNRAYPCVGGAFSYAISDLPSTLPNGTYYLLVGEEGNTGTWKPITALTEITINKNQ